uniref:non-specific serine/threonine protein kinase n=1 Tax=Panagrellus redivivus TaxID=6233 RepID=A0A7E4VPX7_PANRE
MSSSSHSPKPSRAHGAPPSASNLAAMAVAQSNPARRKSSLLGFNFAAFSLNSNSSPSSGSAKDQTNGASPFQSPAPSRKSSGIGAPVAALLRKSSSTAVPDSSIRSADMSKSSKSSQNANAPIPVRRAEDVVISGWLLKRGEHIKNWRQRYFILFRDGALLGFKTQPAANSDFRDPCNDFTVKDVQLMKVEHPKPNTFLVRGLQFTTVIERMLNAESAALRDEWVNAIKRVSDDLKQHQDAEAVDQDQEMVDVSDLPTAMEPGTYDASIHGSLSTNVNVFSGFEAFGQQRLQVQQKPSTSKIPPSKRSRVTLNDFEFLKMLGVGSFGKVVLSREKRSGRLYAIKILKKAVVVSKDEVQHTMTENRVLQKCKHPFLTELTYSFQTQDRLCFVMEFAIGGDLYYHLNCEVRQKKVGFDENRCRFYGAEIVMALGYLHDNNIVYRDLKLENLLLDKDGHIKIADFGLCKEDITYNDRTRTFCGTPEYLAPEVLEDNDYGRAVDWWGVGVVMYEMLCGRLPFYSDKHDKLFELILNSNLRFPSRLSPPAVDLLIKLLVKNPTQRLGGGPDDWREIQVHEFFRPINWDKLYRKEIPPPYKPDLKSETDTKYFDVEFTKNTVQLTPPSARDGPLESIDEQDDIQANFTQFSFHDLRDSSLYENSERTFRGFVENMEE